MEPKEVLCFVKSKIKKEWIQIFCTTFILGIIAHGYKFLNIIPNWDSLVYSERSKNAITSGRWFLIIADRISSFNDIPWIIGLISLIYIALSSICIIELFKVKKKFSMILITCIMITFPSLISAFSYMFMADTLFLAMLFSCLAVLISVRNKKGFLVGAILIGCSIGIYQSYVSFAMLLIILWIILEILFCKLSMKELMLQITKFLGMGILGVTFYWIAFKMLLNAEGISNSVTHQGMDAIGIPSIKELGSAIYKIAREFYVFFFGSIGDISFASVLNFILFFGIIIFSLYFVYKNKIFLKVDKMILLIISVIAIPLVAFIYFVFTPEIWYHTLMEHSLVLIYVFFVILIENINLKKGRFRVFISWGTSILLFLMVYNFTMMANSAYATMNKSYEKTYAAFVRVVDRMEQLENYEDVEKVAVVGRFGSGITLSGTPELVGVPEDYFVISQEYTLPMLRYYFDISLEEVNVDELKALKQTEAYKNLETWPSKHSMIVIDNILVMKLS